MTTTEQVLTKIGLKGTNTAYTAKDETARNLAAQAQTTATEAKTLAESMQSQVDEKNTQIETLTADLQTASAEVTSLNNQLTTVQGQLETANSELVTLREQVKLKPGRELSEYTWDEIIELADDAKVNPSKYEYLLGQMKDLTSSEYASPISMQLIGINHDDLSDGSGKAGFTFLSNDVVDTVKPYGSYEYRYTTSTYDGNIPGKLTKIYDTIQEPIKSNIKQVTKAYYTCNTYSSSDGSYSKKQTHNDYLWLPSEKEVYGTSSKNLDDGTIYQYFEKNPTAAKTLKYWINRASSQTNTWWLRTPGPDKFLVAGGQYGVTTSSNQTEARLAIGFCI